AANKKRIRCVVLSVPVDAGAWTARGAMVQELVPGADPYVAQLIRRLQEEVREERHAAAVERRERIMRAIEEECSAVGSNTRFDAAPMSNDLEVPWFDMPEEESWDEEPSADFLDLDRTDDAMPAW